MAGRRSHRAGLHAVQFLDHVLHGALTGQRVGGADEPVQVLGDVVLGLRQDFSGHPRLGCTLRSGPGADNRRDQTGVHGSPDGLGGVHAERTQRVRHLFDGRRRVPLAGESRKRPIDERTPTPGITALHCRIDGQRHPIGLRDRGVRQREQPPGVGAQQFGGVIPDRFHQPARPACRNTLRHKQFRNRIRLAGTDPRGVEAIGALRCHLW